jgi:O-antigen/teichoic acid export membrane protein
MTDEALSRASRRIAVGGSLRFAGRAGGALVTLVMYRLLAGRLGPDEYGPVVVGLAWLVVFGAIGSFGVGRAASRAIARGSSDARALVRSGTAVTAATGSLAALAMVGTGWLAYRNSRPTAEVVSLLAISVVAVCELQASSLMLGALRRNGLRAIADVASSVLALLGTIVVLAAHRGVLAWAMAYTAAYVATAVVTTLVVHRLALAAAVGTAGLAGGPNPRELLREAAPMGASDVVNGVYYRIDAVMLSLISGERSVAIYGVAYQLAAFAVTVPQFLSVALLPEFMSHDPARRQILVRRCIAVVVGAGVVVTALAVTLAPEAVRVLGGDRFEAAATSFAILGGAIGLSFVSGFLSDVVVFSGGERAVAKVVGLVTATNLVANAVAIPIAGPSGAATAMLISQFVACAGMITLYRRAGATMPTAGVVRA